MVSKDAYGKLIKRFLDKHEKTGLLGKKVADKIFDLWKWVIEYDSHMKGAQSTAEIKKAYIKRGANILVQFVKAANEDVIALKDRLLNCKLAVLQDKPAQNVCTDSDRKNMENLIKDYNSFIQEIIGCKDKGAEYILNILKRLSNILGEEYKQIERDLENECIHLSVEALKL